ncbi:hypothetical protein D7X30_01945 [Corallococcus sp. AB011P]|uniref:hypothetical protein n=1 Tax=Corallococcus sp. AB011P TaxID=2316735 RepID=UPI000EA0FDA1|nr:hypothetical protein [Corallococcus sp. AB011P]RKG62113.1 hypothetical protein D7X30_01945 [Corallococcus sp. AB011P]
MSRSFLAYTALSSAAVATFLLSGCDPICTNGVSKPGQGQVTRNAAGTCVQLVVTRPDAGEGGGSDGGDGGDGGELPDAGTDGGVCGAGPGWTTHVVDEGINSLTSTFIFDAQGVGHYAYAKGLDFYVGTTRPGETPARLGEAWAAIDVNMAVAADGTHHVLYQQGEYVGYATDAQGTWDFNILGRGWSRAVALDAQGQVHVLIARPSPQVGYLLGHRAANGAWSLPPVEELEAAGDRERLAVDANGHLHLAFARGHGITSQVVYASNASGTWVTEPLDWDIPVSSPRLRIALEVDPTGRPSLVGSDEQGAWLWVKEDNGWTSYGLGAFRSRGPALSRSLFFPNIRHVLLDDADAAANTNGSTSQMIVKMLYGTAPVGSTRPLVLETLDGGNAFPGPSSIHVDEQDQIQVGFTYVHYDYPPDGGALQTTRGLRYARYCP